MWRDLTRTQWVTLVAAVALTAVAGVGEVAPAPDVAEFVVSGVALAALAALVGQTIDQVGERLGPGSTGLLQSALGNLPELFVSIFALRQGLTKVVQAALIGSVLSNALLVLGLAFVVGGLRHGAQRFMPDAPRMVGTLLILAVGALLFPTLTVRLHTPASPHIGALSDATAIVLLAVYAVSIPFWLRGGPGDVLGQHLDRPDDRPTTAAAWPLRLSVTLLAVGSVGAALASDWFVGALQPATKTLGLSQTFTGLVIVAIASNAVEHAVSVRFAFNGRPEYALSTILNSALQIALLLTPVLVLVSGFVGPTKLTLVFPTLLVAALAVAAVVVVVVIYDGEYTWLEGVALIALYGIIAASFWWG